MIRPLNPRPLNPAYFKADEEYFIMDRNGKHSKFIPLNASERHNAISKEAYFLAAKRGFAPGEDQQDWYWAEEDTDDKIFSQDLEPNERYSALMTKFFTSENIDELTETELAKKFMDFMHSNHKYLTAIKKEITSRSTFDLRNVSILTSDTPLSWMTKRALLIADSTLLGHPTNKFTEYKTEGFCTDPAYDIWEDVTYCTNCPDLLELGYWLKRCRGLLERGDVFYYPKVKVERVRTQYQGYQQFDWGTTEDHLYDALVSSRKIVQNMRDNPLKADFIRAIIEIVKIHLPFVGRVDLSAFSKISCDEHRRLETFRSFFREQFLELSSNEGSVSFDRNLQRIGIRIRNGVRALASDFRSLRRKAAFQSVGATIGTVVATLLAINSEVFPMLPTILGPSVGLTVFLKFIEEDYEKLSRLKDSPYYYLWILESK
jgi:hypothetical protein